MQNIIIIYERNACSFDRVYQRTSKALGVSYTSVHRIMNGKRPCKSNRPKERANILDDFDHCVIKKTIHILPEGIYGASDPSFGSHI
jgi:hypothetical protein